MTLEFIAVIALIAAAVHVNFESAHLRRLKPEPLQANGPGSRVDHEANAEVTRLSDR